MGKVFEAIGRHLENSRCSLLSIASGLDCRSERGAGEGEWNTVGKVFKAIGRQLEDSWKLIGT